MFEIVGSEPESLGRSLELRAPLSENWNNLNEILIHSS